MIQSSLNDFFCLTHKKKIISVCLNQACQKCRLICFDCLKNTEHNSHLNDLQDFENLEAKISETKPKYNNLIAQMNQMIDNIINIYNRIKKGIDKKYNLTSQMINVLSGDEFIQYIENMVSFDQYSDTISKQILQHCSEFEQKLNIYLMELQLDTLSYNFENQKITSQEETCQPDVSKEDKIMAQKLYKQGHTLYWIEKDFDGAIKLFDQALGYDRNHLDSLFCKGSSLKLKGLYKDSLEWFDKALSIDSKDVASLFSKAECLRKMKQYQDSIIWFDKALEISPDDINSLNGKGTSLRQMGLFKDALELQKKAFELNPNDKLTLYECGATLRSLKQFDEALIYLNKALQIDQNHWLSLGCKGACLIQLQKFDEAFLCLNKAIEIDPQNTFFQKQLKICLEKAKLASQ